MSVTKSALWLETLDFVLLVLLLNIAQMDLISVNFCLQAVLNFMGYVFKKGLKSSMCSVPCQRILKSRKFTDSLSVPVVFALYVR